MKTLALLLILTISSLAFSDEYDSKYMLSDLASPVTTKSNLILYSGALLSVASLLYENGSNEDLQKGVSRAKPLGESSKIGDLAGQLIPNAVYTLGMLGAYELSDDLSFKSKSLHRAFFMFESTLYAGVATTLLKTVVKEQRPNQADYHSFPSGHSTTAFAFAAVVGLEHEWYYSVPAYALAGFVAFSRLNDNAHYLHDTIAGATVGLSYAYGIWYNRHPAANSNAQFFVVPTDDLSGSIVHFKYNY